MASNLPRRARELRRDSTDAERLLWKRLKARQVLDLKFRRQEQIGYYIVDFVCYEVSLIVEADGGQHLENRENDEVRTHWLNSQGFKVLRFWNNDILTNIESVIEVIRADCLNRVSSVQSCPDHPSPQPSPTRGEGVTTES